MAENKVFDMGLLMEDEPFDYVSYSINCWREWLCRAIQSVENNEVKEVKLLTYFSIIDMLSQEWFNYPTRNLQEYFTQFVLKFQNKYDYLELTDPVTLYYRVEDLVSGKISIDCLVDGGVYSPKHTEIRRMAEQIQKVMQETENNTFATKKMKEHRYVDLLYRLRCCLFHEFSASHISYNKSEREPYYINWARQYVANCKIVSDEVWQLNIPVSFVKELCENCIGNFLNYCTENHVSPNQHSGMERLCELSWYNK